MTDTAVLCASSPMRMPCVRTYFIRAHTAIMLAVMMMLMAMSIRNVVNDADDDFDDGVDADRDVGGDDVSDVVDT